MAHLFQSEHVGKDLVAHVYKISGENIWLVKQYINGQMVTETEFLFADEATKFAKDITAVKDKKKSKKDEDTSADE